MVTHSNFISSTNDGGIFYDIDASSDQSGSPVYYCGSENTKLVGIHKSYWPQKHLNFATLITDAVIIVMQGWANELKSSFQINHDKDNFFSESTMIIRDNKSSNIMKDTKTSNIIKDSKPSMIIKDDNPSMMMKDSSNSSMIMKHSNSSTMIKDSSPSMMVRNSKSSMAVRDTKTFKEPVRRNVTDFKSTPINNQI